MRLILAEVPFSRSSFRGHQPWPASPSARDFNCRRPHQPLTCTWLWVSIQRSLPAVDLIIPQIRCPFYIAKTGEPGSWQHARLRNRRNDIFLRHNHPARRLSFAFWPVCAQIICRDLATGPQRRLWQFKPKCDPTLDKRLVGKPFRNGGGRCGHNRVGGDLEAYKMLPSNIDPVLQPHLFPSR